jgi:multidrug efflux pump subunit AcrA (membrane-fusion protein)
MRILATLIAFWLLVAVQGRAEEPMRVESARRQVVLSGYTRPQSSMTLSAEVPGRIVRRRCEIGQAVGDAPVFEIDPTFVDFQLAAVRQTIAQQRVAQRRSASRAAFLQREFQRLDTLVQRDSAAVSRRDAAAEELAQAQLEGESAAVQLAHAQNQLAELEERRRRHSVLAPKGWQVTGRSAETGEIVQPNLPLAALADFRTLVVPLALGAEELAALRRLPPVFPAWLDNRPVRAAIRSVNPQFDEKTRKVAVELTLSEVAGEHRGGLLFTLPLDIHLEGLQVPRAALLSRYEHPRVVLKGGGEAVAVEVLGESNGQVIVAPHPRLAPGMELTAP